MKIAFVIDSFNRGGMERRCLRLIQGLHQRGNYEILLIIVNNGVSYDEIYATSAIVKVINKKKVGPVKAGLDIFKILNEFEPDIIQSWGMVLSSFYVNIYRISHRFLYIGSYVANCFKPKGWDLIMNKWNYCMMDYIVGNSLEGLKSYGIPQNKRRLSYNGYIHSKETVIDKDDKKKEFGISTQYVVSMIANMHKYKDYDTYLSCCRKISTYRNDVTFLCVGGGPLVEYYRAQLNDDEKKKIRILGFREDVDDIIKMTDIAVLSTFTEGIPNSVMESMALGVPAVVTRGGGTPELIDDEVDGYLVEVQNVEQLSERIEILLNDENLRTNMGVAASKKIQIRFSFNRMIDEFVDIYSMIKK